MYFVRMPIIIERSGASIMIYCVIAGRVDKAESFPSLTYFLMANMFPLHPQPQKGYFFYPCKNVISESLCDTHTQIFFLFSFLITCMLTSELYEGNEPPVMPKDIRSRHSKIVSDPRTPYFSCPSEPILIVKTDCNVEFSESS